MPNRRLIDPLVSLAFSIYTNKGIYALLLGSGLSNAAGIPTGWEIVSDLIRRIAKLENEDAAPDPIAWFTKKYSREPNYSELLDSLTRSPTERRQLISNYIEPTKETEGLRTPTPAHRAIAQLVAAGYIKVIITTNFDRLIEQALSECGIIPTVISSLDGLMGAVPLQHSACTVIKLHGDYLDTRIKNSSGELAGYDPAMDKLLDRIFDEFGLLVAGWSAEWDIALRAAIERCPNHRFGVYWAVRGEPSDEAQRLINHRKADLISIKHADQFFVDLREKVLSLEQINTQHPLSQKLAIATVKRYLVDNRFQITLADLVSAETERVVTAILSDEFSIAGPSYTKTDFLLRIDQFNSLCSVLYGILMTGCRWDSGTYNDYWLQSLCRLANVSTAGSGLVGWIKLRHYPALVALYVMGLTWIHRRKYSLIDLMLTKTTIKNSRMEETPIVLSLTWWSPFEGNGAQWLHKDNRYTPINDHLFSILRPLFMEMIPDETDFEETFDRFEYFQALLYVHAAENSNRTYHSPPPTGRFWWRNRDWDNARTVMKDVEAEVQKHGVNWPPLKEGLFDGTTENFNTAKKHVDLVLSKYQG